MREEDKAGRGLGNKKDACFFYILFTIKKDCGFGFYVFRGVFFFSFLYICSLIFFIFMMYPGHYNYVGSIPLLMC